MKREKQKAEKGEMGIVSSFLKAFKKEKHPPKILSEEDFKKSYKALEKVGIKASTHTFRH